MMFVKIVVVAKYEYCYALPGPLSSRSVLVLAIVRKSATPGPWQLQLKTAGGASVSHLSITSGM